MYIFWKWSKACFLFGNLESELGKSNVWDCMPIYKLLPFLPIHPLACSLFESVEKHAGVHVMYKLSK